MTPVHQLISCEVKNFVFIIIKKNIQMLKHYFNIVASGEIINS